MLNGTDTFFPGHDIPVTDEHGNLRYTHYGHGGVETRDYIAIQMFPKVWDISTTDEEAADRAYAAADALIARSQR